MYFTIQSSGKALFILHVMIEMLSLHMMQSETIIYGLGRKCVNQYLVHILSPVTDNCSF